MHESCPGKVREAKVAFEVTLLIYPHSRFTLRNIDLVDNYIRRNSVKE